MLGPKESDWGFQEIAVADPERADRLAGTGSPNALIVALDDALRKALTEEARIGFDGIDNDLSARRATIQFPVPTELYDWFFNARTGYRAQYWISPHVGNTFNTQLLRRLRTTIEIWTPCLGVSGREIWVEKHYVDRKHIDKGPRTESRNTFLRSFDLELSKVWICERQIQRDGGDMVSMPLGSVGPKLCIPKWQESGLFAPFPEPGDAWLDVKGCYVQDGGKVEQPNKSPEQRANQIHKTGWT